MMMVRAFFLAVCVAMLTTPAAQAAGGGGASKKKTSGSESFVELPSLTASIVDNFQVRAILQVEAGLDIKNARDRAKAERMAPRLRAACAEALRAYAGDEYVYGRVPDASRIADAMQAAVNHELGFDDGHLLLGMVLIHNAAR